MRLLDWRTKLEKRKALKKDLKKRINRNSVVS